MGLMLAERPVQTHLHQLTRVVGPDATAPCIRPSGGRHGWVFYCLKRQQSVLLPLASYGAYRRLGHPDHYVLVLLNFHV
jgi:hypothetical protein